MSKQPARPSAGKYRGWIAFAFLGVVALLCTQYGMILYGPAKVLLSPVGYHGPDSIGLYAAPDPDTPPEAVQQPGVYVIDWSVWEQTAYRLDDGTTLPLAEGAVALLTLLALPLLLTLRGRMLWPRWPLWLLAGLGAVSVLNADHFRASVIELVQWVLVLLVTYWLAGVSLVDPDQLKALGRWLAFLTIVLLGLAWFDYYRFVLLPVGDAEAPMAVRATCASRSAFGGLMVLLLPLAFARVVAVRNLIVKAVYLAIFTTGLSLMTAGGAVIAVCAAAMWQAAQRGWRPALATLVLVPGLALGSGWMMSKNHLRHLGESIQFYQRAPDGTPFAVEKRYLEMTAGFNALTDSRYVLPPGATEESGSAEIVGYRGNLTAGVGVGQNYQKSIGGYYRSLDNPEKQEPDTYNLYLLLAVQVGLFGALAWAWVLCDGAALGRLASRGLADEPLRALALGIAGSCVGVLVFSVFGTVLIRGVGPLLVVLLAAAARLAGQLEPAQPVAIPPTPNANQDVVASSEPESVTE